MAFIKFKRLRKFKLNVKLFLTVLTLKFIIFTIFLVSFINSNESFCLEDTSNNYYARQKNEGNQASLQLDNIISRPFTTRNRNIFFLETSQSDSNDDVSLNERQACSIESTALVNPTANINVIFVTNSKLKISKIVKTLMNHKNVAFYRLDLLEFSLGTPVEAWVKSKIIYDHRFLTETISDFLRLLVLWR